MLTFSFFSGVNPKKLVFLLIAFTWTSPVATEFEVKNECESRRNQRAPAHLNLCCYRSLDCRCIKALCKQSQYVTSVDCVDDQLYHSQCGTSFQANCGNYLVSTYFSSNCDHVDPDLTTKEQTKINGSTLSTGTDQPRAITSKTGSGATLMIVIVVMAVLLMTLIVIPVWFYCSRSHHSEGQNGAEKTKTVRSSSERKRKAFKRHRASSARAMGAGVSKPRQQCSLQGKGAAPDGAISTGGASFKRLSRKVAKGDRSVRVTKNNSSSRKGSFDSRAVNTRQVKQSSPSASRTNQATNQEISKLRKLIQ